MVPYYKHILAAPSFLSKTVIIISLAENIHNILKNSLSSCATITFLFKSSVMVIFYLFLSKCFYIPESCLYPAGSTWSHGFLVASSSKNRKQLRIPIVGFETDGQNRIFHFKRMDSDAISNHKFDELQCTPRAWDGTLKFVSCKQNILEMIFLRRQSCLKCSLVYSIKIVRTNSEK